jgi:transcriptional antiterminator
MEVHPNIPNNMSTEISHMYLYLFELTSMVYRKLEGVVSRQ